MKKYVMSIITVCLIIFAPILMTGCDNDDVEVTFVSETYFTMWVNVNGEYAFTLIEGSVVFSEIGKDDVISVTRGIDHSFVIFDYEGTRTTIVPVSKGMIVTILPDGINGYVIK